MIIFESRPWSIPERHITPELKQVESVVLNAETKINQLEYELSRK